MAGQLRYKTAAELQAAIDEYFAICQGYGATDENGEAERQAMLAWIKRLKAKNDKLEQEVCNQYASIQKLLTHVNVAEVLGVETKNGKHRESMQFGRISLKCTVKCDLSASFVTFLSNTVRKTCDIIKLSNYEKHLTGVLLGAFCMGQYQSGSRGQS